MKAAVVLGLACALGAMPLPARSQTAAATPLAGQALVHIRDGALQGCGIRLTGGQPGAAASAWFDVSFNVFGRGIALAQSIAYEIRSSGYESTARPERVSVQSTWIKAAEGSARLGENADREDSLVYSLSFDDALALFEAVATGRTLSIGIKRWGQPSATLYTGEAQLDVETREQVADCLGRLPP